MTVQQQEACGGDERLGSRAEFAAALGGMPVSARDWDRVCARYPANASAYYLGLARSASCRDPILRQCLPDRRELAGAEADPDPLAEQRDSPLPGLVHRYPNRVLLIVTNQCALRCRHCLRKRIWTTGESETLGPSALPRAVAYLKEHPEVRQVLISGGDPLMLPDALLEEYLVSLRSVPHLEVLRIGTRMPAVQPGRISDSLCDMLRAQAPVWVATQFNHPAELTEAARAACSRFLRSGIPMVNQSVLLRGVNDDADTLTALFRGLLRFGVKPYYLFHGDPVRGTGHFRSGVSRGLALMAEVRERLSGLAMPSFALDLPGGAGKVILTPETPIRETAEGTVELTLADGRILHYPGPPKGATASAEPGQGCLVLYERADCARGVPA